MNPLHVHWQGTVPYDQAWEQQKQITAVMAAQPDTADTLLLQEHPPTYTLGRRTTLDHLLISQAELDAKNFTLRWVDRGGDITYHGPGQLVGYPLLNLKRLFANRGHRRPKLHDYLRDLEEVLIVTLAAFGVSGWRYPGYTGVWVDGPTGPEKIAAIGIKVSGQGISSHGFALNVHPDLSHFGHIIPCGISEHNVTSLAQIAPRPWHIPDLLPTLINAFCQQFQLEAVETPSQVISS